MELWNREELYSDVWEQSLIKLVAKYGISGVALGKACRKLKIPVPGRGYWAQKQHGKPVKRAPLPPLKTIPVVYRMKMPDPNAEKVPTVPPPEPTDPEWIRIREMECRSIPLTPDLKQHKLVAATLRNLSKAKTDNRGLLEPRADMPCLDIRVSPGTLNRALDFMNAVIQVLEAESFHVTMEKGLHGTSVQIFGFRVQFGIVEKTNLKGRRVVKEYSWTRTVMDYEPNGHLEFRVGEYSYGSQRGVRDGTKQRLEDLIPQAVGALMREGRELGIRAERRKQEEIERHKRDQERAVLAHQICEEEKKVGDLERWVELWFKARAMRDFIAALEKVWSAEGRDLSPEAPNGQRILWMKQQADRLDPTVPSPPSILDRKNETRGW